MLNRLLTLFAIVSLSVELMASPAIHVTYNCDSAVLWVNKPSAPLVYYWQGTICGTDMALSDTTYKVLTTGTYFLKAYNTSASTWASTSCDTAIVKLSQYPAAPPVPTYADGKFTLTDPPVNVLYYLQGTSCGNSTANHGTNFPISTTGTYYFNSLDTAYKCWSTSCTDVNIVIVGTEEYYKLNRNIITISPNPTVDRIKVSFPAQIEKANLVIYDFSGKVVFQKSDVVNSSVIDLLRLKPGTYIARFNCADMDQSIKLVITR